MTLDPVTSPISTKTTSPAVLADLSPSGLRAEQNLDEVLPDDPFALPGEKFRFSANPDAAGNTEADVKPEADESEEASQLDTDGEPVQDASDSTAIMLSLDEQASPPTPDSFLTSYWPYLLVVMAMGTWVVVQLKKKSEPSYEHKPVTEKSIEAGSKVSGQFKVSQRFQKTESTKQNRKSKRGIGIQRVRQRNGTGTAMASSQPKR